MIILLFSSLKAILPMITQSFSEFGTLALVAFVMLAGLVMIFGAVGMPISAGLGATVAHAIFSAIGYVVSGVIRFIRWIVQGIIRLIPRIYRFSRRTLIGSFRLNPTAGTIISFLITVATIAVII